MEREIQNNPIVNEQGQDRVISRKIAAWMLLLSQLSVAVVLGLLISLWLTPQDQSLVAYWAMVTGVIWIVIWVPFGHHWFFFYYKGIIISGKRNRLTGPCFKHDCLWDKFRNYVWPKRHSVPLNEIERLYNSKKRKSRKTSDGKTLAWTVYELNVSGTFGSLTMEFRERNKRDETRNAIQEVMKSSALSLKESTDNFY